MADNSEKVNAKFTRDDNSTVTVTGIEKDEVIDLVYQLRDPDQEGWGNDISVHIGPVKKVDIVDENGKETQTVYGNKRENS